MRHKFTGIYRDSAGNVVTSGTVSVYLAGTTTAASVYTSSTSSTSVGSVTSSSTDGSFEFYVDRFEYDRDQQFKIILSKSGLTSKTYDYIEVDDLASGTYTISADKTVSTNLGYIPKGVVYSVSTGVTLTISGTFDSGRYQIFSGLGTVKLTGLLSEVFAEWFPNSGAGLQSAIDSTSNTYGQTVSIGIGTTIDIGSSTVTLRKATQLKGESRYSSAITMADGSISYGTYAAGINRTKIIENLKISNSGTASKTINMGDISATYGPYENVLRNCYVSGGKYSVYMDNISLTILENNEISNNVNDAEIYAIYGEATKQPTSLSLRGNSIHGKANIGYGAAGSYEYAAVDISEMNVFQSSYGYAIKLDKIIALNMQGNYVETWADIQPLYIGKYTRGGKVSGNVFSPNSGNSSTAVPVTVEGSGIEIGGNFINKIGSQANIELTLNSKNNIVGANDDNYYISYVTDVGTSNKVYPSGVITYQTTTQATTSGTNNTAILTSTFPVYSMIGRQILNVNVAGVISGTNNNKAITFTLGNTPTTITLLTAENVTGNYVLMVSIHAVSSASQKIQYALWLGTTLKYQGYTTATENMALAVNNTLSVKAQCTNASDSVTMEMGKIYYQ